MSALDENLKPPSFHIWLAFLAIASLMLVNLFLPRGDNPSLRGVGVAVLIMAGVLIFAPFTLLRKHGQIHDGRIYMQTSVVVDQGLYAITRHPQYLGYIFLACGFALLSQHWVATLLAGVGASFFYLQAVSEERFCLARFGEPYEQYLWRVPRFNIFLGLMRLLQRDGE